MKYGSKAVPYLVKSVKFLKSVVNVEKHLFDQSVSITSANAGFINCLSLLPQEMIIIIDKEIHVK